MAKELRPWSEGALQLYAQSETNKVGIQLFKIVLEAVDFSNTPLSQSIADPFRESAQAIEEYLQKSVIMREQARTTLLTLNPDVNVSVLFHDEEKTYGEAMAYAVCQRKLVDWARNPNVTVHWWPINFKTHDDAKTFVIRFFEAALKAVGHKNPESAVTISNNLNR